MNVQITVEEMIKDTALKENVSVKMDSLDQIVVIQLVLILVVTMENVIKENVNAILDLKDQTAQFKHALTTVLTREYAADPHFINAYAIKNTQE